MNITGIEIARVIVHEVIKPNESAERPPIFSDALVTLDTLGKALVAKRLVDTVSTGSQCVDVDVDDDSKGSVFDVATEMLDKGNRVFVEKSKWLAKTLAESQSAGSIKSGVAFLVQGTCFMGGRPCRFLAIIKADADQALVKQLTTSGINLSFVSETFLGASQRLIKIALFFERSEPDNERERRVPAEFDIKVFDHLMQIPGGDAALYFYHTFLGCTISQDAGRKTKNFYEITKEYIQALDVAPEEKLEMYADLGSYLRSNKRTIHPREYATEYLPESEQDAFINLCRNQKLGSAFSKDTKLITPRLKRFSMKFTSQVSITAPQDKWKESIEVVGTKDGWTTIKIRGEIEGVT